MRPHGACTCLRVHAAARISCTAPASSPASWRRGRLILLATKHHTHATRRRIAPSARAAPRLARRHAAACHSHPAAALRASRMPATPQGDPALAAASDPRSRLRAATRLARTRAWRIRGAHRDVCVHMYMGMPMGIQCTVRCGVARGPQRARACAQHAPSREDADSTDASARPAPANRGGNDVLVSVARASWCSIGGAVWWGI